MEFNPYSYIHQYSYISYPNIFDIKTLEKLEHYCKTFPCEGDNGITRLDSHKTYRKVSNILYFPQSLESFENQIHKYIFQSNNTLGFDINNIHYSYSEYIQGPSHLKWHNDIAEYPYNTRKISFSVNVNNDNEFEGGNLEFNLGGGEIITAPQSKGNITLFPSFLLHRITPVTRGVRKVLIGFVTGPPYK
jgi:PKHD-type hydroxylase